MQKIQMALMLAAQQLQQNRAQRFRSELFMQKARNQLVNSRPDKQRKQDMRNVPFPDAPDGQAAASTQKQNAAAHQKQRNRASCKAAPEQAFQPRSAPDLPAEQDLAGYMDHHHADDRKRFRVINGGDPAAGHRLRRFLKELHTILPSTGSGRWLHSKLAVPTSQVHDPAFLRVRQPLVYVQDASFRNMKTYCAW